jgi:limonene-1,2-epoxide hydrolase
MERPASAGEASPEEVVRRFCAAVSARDLELLRPMLANDVVYHNMPMEPSRGIDATLEALATLFVMFEEIGFEIAHLATTGTTVLTERVDLLRTARVEALLPVMGAFEVRDGRIVAWRDYFDVAQAGSLLSDG